MTGRDLTEQLQAQITQAVADREPLLIKGGNTKLFYGRPSSAQQTLNIKNHAGILAYEPTELVVNVRAGTELRELNAVLLEQSQMLGFEPPSFSDQATIGGTIACGFSGPRRPFGGSARDVVIGCTILNGLGERLHFGGQVMKNVAGFDVSRLMVGALGQLGVLLDIAIRVAPRPDAELTLCQEVSSIQTAITVMQQYQTQFWPITALTYGEDKQLRIRLSGAEKAIQIAAQNLGGEKDVHGEIFWQQLKEHQLSFFQGTEPLWRISCASGTPHLAIPGTWLIDWGGAQRWLKTAWSGEKVHQFSEEYQASACCFRSISSLDDWIKLPPNLLALHKNLKQAFDPHQILNPGRFYSEL